jgi:flagellar FliJ protein
VKAFVFNLQKALDIRSYKEQETEIALGRAVRIQAEIEPQIKNLAAELFTAETRRFETGNSAHDMRAWDLYITRLENTREDLFKSAAEAELITQTARENYIEASRNRKVLDKLKEKRLKEYRKEKQRDEDKALDDISGSRGYTG